VSRPQDVQQVGSARPVLAVVDWVALDAPADPYLTLRALSQYSGCSVRWLRDRLSDAEHPLPCYRLPGYTITKGERKDKEMSGKILVRRSEFDAWIARFRHTGARPEDPGFAADVDRIVARAAL
jgi:hypothetical protein